jgi:hypothetical protein
MEEMELVRTLHSCRVLGARDADDEVDLAAGG